MSVPANGCPYVIGAGMTLQVLGFWIRLETPGVGSIDGRSGDPT